MSKYFEIDGYWKDDLTKFTGYLVREYNDVVDNILDDEIFYYGLSEVDIKAAIIDGKNGVSDTLDFVITNYKEV